MRGTLQVICVVVGASVLAGCGSTSSLKSSSGQKLVCDRQFDCVQVARFKSTITKTDTPLTKIDWACGQFADLIVQELKATGAFKSVSRVENISDANDTALLIGGEVTRYQEGSAMARFMIGLGAGSSYFDANVQFVYGKDRKEIGVIRVDKNSWVLGGGYASSQTPEKYMAQAAKKVAAETKQLATPK